MEKKNFFFGIPTPKVALDGGKIGKISMERKCISFMENSMNPLLLFPVLYEDNALDFSIQSTYARPLAIILAIYVYSAD